MPIGKAYPENPCTSVLGSVKGYNAWELLDWVIIGAKSPYSIKTFPKWEWVKEIVEACDNSGIPVFLKNNLRLPKYNCEGAMPFYRKHPTGTMELRQELPHTS